MPLFGNVSKPLRVETSVPVMHMMNEILVHLQAFIEPGSEGGFQFAHERRDSMAKKEVQNVIHDIVFIKGVESPSGSVCVNSYASLVVQASSFNCRYFKLIF